MTKGHYHTVAQTAEVYLCIAGEGMMAMKSAAGRWESRSGCSVIGWFTFRLTGDIDPLIRAMSR